VVDLGVIRHWKDPLRIGRRELRARRGNDISVPTQFKCPRARLGSDYGGWWTRTDVLNSESIVYSVGIGQDISFDLGLIERFGLSIHAFDPTRKCRDWLRTQRMPRQFIFTTLGLADYDGVGSFVLRSRPDWDNYELNVPDAGAFDREELPVARLATLMNRFGHHHLDILKIDIEGSEFDVLTDVLASDLEVRQILVEFHYADQGTLARARSALDDLKRAGYAIFARSPLGFEFSFCIP
jgi:FkbM family methyltransferase